MANDKTKCFKRIMKGNQNTKFIDKLISFKINKKFIENCFGNEIYSLDTHY